MNNLSKISISILCGGFGKRLHTVVPDRQKAIAEVVGYPFITFILNQISDAGGKDVILCTGFMGGQVEELLGNKYKTLSLRYSKENKPLGTAGAIINALDMLKSDVIMVYNGDSYCNINPQSLLDRHFSIKSACTLLLVKVPDVSRYGCVNFDPNYLITSFEEKKKDKRSGWINAGIYCLNRELIAEVPARKLISFEKDFFPAMIGKGLFAFPRDAEFIDIGTPDSYKQAETFFRNIKGPARTEECRSDKQ